MRIRIGCSLTFDLQQETPLVTLLTVHYSRVDDLEAPDVLKTDPSVEVSGYRDLFGNWCSRMVAPAGRFTLGTDTVIRDGGAPDPTLPEVLQHRVQAICDFVHQHIVFGYDDARATRTASEAFHERKGVCRDFAHLAISFCRCLNIPARYCTGYLSDIGVPPPHGVSDFAAWMEVYLGGRWWTFDPRNNVPMIGRILIAQGRDAADVPLTQIFGPGVLADFRVMTFDADDGDATLPDQGPPPSAVV
jgi:hypothetical protein